MTHVSTLLGLISSVYRDLPPMEIKPATTECRAKTLPLTTNSHHTQVTPNQLVMVITRPFNLNVSCLKTNKTIKKKMYILLKNYKTFKGGARGVMVIAVGIGHDDISSYPGLIALHIALMPLGKV